MQPWTSHPPVSWQLTTDTCMSPTLSRTTQLSPVQITDLQGGELDSELFLKSLIWGQLVIQQEFFDFQSRELRVAIGSGRCSEILLILGLAGVAAEIQYSCIKAYLRMH